MSGEYEYEDDETPNESMPVKDNKRDKMKKNISAHQREMLQIDILKEEMAVKKQALEIMQNNITSNKENMKMISDSISQIGQGIREGLGMLSNSLIQCCQID